MTGSKHVATNPTDHKTKTGGLHAEGGGGITPPPFSEILSLQGEGLTLQAFKLAGGPMQASESLKYQIMSTPSRVAYVGGHPKDAARLFR